MGYLEGGGLDGKCHLFFAVLRAMVCHREAQTRRRADGILVAQPGGIFVVVKLRPFLRERFGFYFRLRVHLDPLHSEFSHPPPP